MARNATKTAVQPVSLPVASYAECSRKNPDVRGWFRLRLPDGTWSVYYASEEALVARFKDEFTLVRNDSMPVPSFNARECPSYDPFEED